MKTFFEKNKDYFYFAFRVLVGIGFLLHGLSKVPGVTSGKTVVLSLMFLATIIETIGGIFIILGLFTRTTATIAALEMAYAFLFIHTKMGGLNPLANKGEVALLYFAAFLVLASIGGKKWSFDKN